MCGCIKIINSLMDNPPPRQISFSNLPTSPLISQKIYSPSISLSEREYLTRMMESRLSIEALQHRLQIKTLEHRLEIQALLAQIQRLQTIILDQRSLNNNVQRLQQDNFIREQCDDKINFSQKKHSNEQYKEKQQKKIGKKYISSQKNQQNEQSQKNNLQRLRQLVLDKTSQNVSLSRQLKREKQLRKEEQNRREIQIKSIVQHKHHEKNELKEHFQSQINTLRRTHEQTLAQSIADLKAQLKKKDNSIEEEKRKNIEANYKIEQITSELQIKKYQNKLPFLDNSSLSNNIFLMNQNDEVSAVKNKYTLILSIYEKQILNMKTQCINKQQIIDKLNYQINSSIQNHNKQTEEFEQKIKLLNKTLQKQQKLHTKQIQMLKMNAAKLNYFNQKIIKEKMLNQLQKKQNQIEKIKLKCNFYQQEYHFKDHKMQMQQLIIQEQTNKKQDKNNNNDLFTKEINSQIQEKNLNFKKDFREHLITNIIILAQKQQIRVLLQRNDTLKNMFNQEISAKEEQEKVFNILIKALEEEINNNKNTLKQNILQLEKQKAKTKTPQNININERQCVKIQYVFKDCTQWQKNYQQRINILMIQTKQKDAQIQRLYKQIQKLKEENQKEIQNYLKKITQENQIKNQKWQKYLSNILQENDLKIKSLNKIKQKFKQQINTLNKQVQKYKNQKMQIFNSIKKKSELQNKIIKLGLNNNLIKNIIQIFQ